MKKMLTMMLVLCMVLACAGPASAETIMEITTDASIQGVTLLDDNGQSVGKVVGCSMRNGKNVWQFQFSSTSAKEATLFVKAADGSWQNTFAVFSIPNASEPVTGNASAAAATPQPPRKPWPEKEYEAKRTSVYDLPSDKRYQSRCGPSRSYHGGGAYKTYKISSIKALFIEDGYVYADLDYTTVGRRRLYFSEDIFTSLSGVPDVSLNGYSAKTTEKLTPRFGPGSKYDEFSEARISAGTSLKVFFEEDGWVFAEFECGLGPVRAWIKESQVKAR